MDYSVKRVLTGTGIGISACMMAAAPAYAQNPFTSGAADRTEVQESGANALRRGNANGMPTPEFSNAVNNISVLGGDDQNIALQSNSLDRQFALPRVSRFATRFFQRSLKQRGTAVTGYGQVASLNDFLSQPNLVAQVGAPAESAVFEEPPYESQVRPAMGLWISGHGQYLDQDETDLGFGRYEADIYGGAVGHDWATGDNGYVGVAIGASDADVEFDENFDGTADDSTIQSLYASFYGGWTEGQASVNGSFVYARHEYDLQRNVFVGPGATGVAESEHDGDEFAADIELAYDLTGDAANWFAPFGGFEYSRLDQDAYSEDGVGGLSQSIEDRETNVLRSRLGIKAGQRWISGTGGVFSLWTSAAWSRDFNLDDREITGSFAGAPGTRNTIVGPETERDGVQFNLGMSYGLEDSFVIGLEGIGEVRDDLETYGGQLVLRKVVY
jgi:outer membrane autotransporter protein